MIYHHTEEFTKTVIAVARDASRPPEGLMSAGESIRILNKDQLSSALNLILNIIQTSTGPKDADQRMSDLATRFGLFYNVSANKFT